MSHESSTALRTLPNLIAACFMIDIALAFAFLINYWVDHPHSRLTNLLHLSQEGNLPTWYSSVQWFSVAALLAIFVARHANRGVRCSWALAALPLLFLGLSLDEVASIHEQLGDMSDRLLPGGDRKATPFPRTGIWMFLLGVPFIAVLWALIAAVRPFMANDRGALAKIVVGMTVMLSGSLIVEIFINLFERGSTGDALQIFVEELLEMLGGTIVLWGSYELARGDELIGARAAAAIPQERRIC
jgi:hypothetical protein